VVTLARLKCSFETKPQPPTRPLEPAERPFLGLVVRSREPGQRILEAAWEFSVDRPATVYEVAGSNGELTWAAKSERLGKTLLSHSRQEYITKYQKSLSSGARFIK
jgi:hypothetical protein